MTLQVSEVDAFTGRSHLYSWGEPQRAELVVLIQRMACRRVNSLQTFC
ncbi:MAG: hypothetical protein VKL39_03200 [Leptolyngbyaceae bacterium]|nr:hypothetical protein [Leptolyngbyaceae bacterium]